ncbi:MAG: thermonuclease family protein [Devosia sp.]|nr:thermonuclease family protein [Devosia sp.]
MLAVLAMMPSAKAACDGLVDGPKGTVVTVVDGDTALLDNGITVRLTGIQAPRLPQGRDLAAWPLAETAKSGLAGLLVGHAVRVRHGGERHDRHGRTLGQLFLADETWVQQRMVASGLARVYSFPDNRACVAALLAAEAAARQQRLGIWADPYYAVRRADRPLELAEHSGRYELVEGRVLHAEAVRDTIYLNFGRYWKEDFTVVIDRPALARFRTAGVDPLGLDGALLRVRGWVDSHDGPRIAVTHPEQIEVLANR